MFFLDSNKIFEKMLFAVYFFLNITFSSEFIKNDEYQVSSFFNLPVFQVSSFFNLPVLSAIFFPRM